MNVSLCLRARLFASALFICLPAPAVMVNPAATRAYYLYYFFPVTIERFWLLLRFGTGGRE